MDPRPAPRLSAEDARAVERALPAVAALDEAALAALYDACEARAYRFGEVVVREGDRADAAFVVAAGRARALMRDRRGHEVHLSALHEGDLFGEIALLRGGVRTATVRASDALRLIRIARERIDALNERFPAVRELFEQHARLREVRDVLRQGPLGQLEAPALTRVARALAAAPAREVEPGEVVVREGDPPGEVYVVERGRLRVHKAAGIAARDIGFLRPGDYFGEVAALTGSARSAAVTTVTAARLLALDRDALEDLLGESPALERLLHETAARYSDAPLAQPLDFASAVTSSGHAAIAAAEARAAAALGLASEDLALARGDGDADAAARGGSADGDPGGPAPALLPDGAARPGPLRRFPLVEQIDEADCGPACLAMACRFYGRRVPLHRLRDLARTRTGGASLKALARAARAVGLRAAPVKLGHRDLDRVPLPAIVHVHGGHWACLVGVGARAVRLADPARGLVRVERAGPQGFEAAWSGFSLLLARSDALDREPEEEPGTLRRFLRDLGRGSERPLALGASLSVAAGGAWVLAALALGGALEAALRQGAGALAGSSGAGEATAVGPAAPLGLAALAVALRAARDRVLAAAGRALAKRAATTLARTLFARTYRYFHERRPGDLERRLASGRALAAVAVEGAGRGAEAAAVLLAAFPALLALSPALAAALAGAGAAWIALAVTAGRRASARAADLDEHRGAHDALVAEAVRAAETVKASGAAGAIAESLAARFGAVADDEAAAGRASAGERAAGGALGLALFAIALALGARGLASSALPLGAVVGALALAVLGAGALDVTAGLVRRAGGLGRTLRRIEDLLEQAPEQDDDASGPSGADGPSGASGAPASGAPRAARAPVPAISGAFAVEDLAVRYGGPEAPLALDGLSLAVPSGARIGLVGRRGAGKTTLVRALLGLVEPARGAVRYDGLDLRDLRLDELRSHVAVAPESPEILTGSLAANVALGAREPDLVRLRAALAAAHADVLLADLPLGLDAALGRGGAPLRHDQAQRIGVARAVYRRPSVLILDEATSVLDPEAERRIVLGLERQLVGATLVVVTDRPTTLKALERIYVVDGGRIVEQGDHDDLLRRRGLYAQIVGR